MGPSVERRQPIRTVRLSHRGGMLHAEERRGWHRHWREPYRFMLAIPWPGFLLSIAASYLLLNLAFTLLYALDLDGIGGAPDGQRLSVLDAFFFSVQTLGSIGYGVLHPSSLWVNLVVTVEAFFGLLFIAVTTGLAFARFSRSRARLRFSRVATIEPWQGHPTLTFRVANVRQNSLVDGRIRASLAMNEESGGRRMRRLVSLPLVRDQSISFQLMWTVMHRVDQHSPLFGLSREELERRQAEILVAFQGLDEILLAPVHFRCSYGAADLRLGEQFRDMVQIDGPDSVFLDFSCFDVTDPQDPPPLPPAPGHGEGDSRSPDPPAQHPWG
ncbi:ion channel [Synechococcus sp. BO 8801]|uniref:ion channel n=1 Tax=Synechococcus sp. BO 8801 TaxID=169670 RepID=UPI000B9845C7|nr:ion channel [Synechococcus sp. BO 8801]